MLLVMLFVSLPSSLLLPGPSTEAWSSAAMLSAPSAAMLSAPAADRGITTKPRLSAPALRMSVAGGRRAGGGEARGSGRARRPPSPVTAMWSVRSSREMDRGRRVAPRCMRSRSWSATAAAPSASGAAGGGGTRRAKTSGGDGVPDYEWVSAKLARQ